MLEIRVKRTDIGSNKRLKRLRKKVDKEVYKTLENQEVEELREHATHHAKVLETYEEYIDLIMEEIEELRAIVMPYGYYKNNREYINKSLKGKILRDRIKMLREITIDNEAGGS